jgi:hypothetical protein
MSELGSYIEAKNIRPNMLARRGVVPMYTLIGWVNHVTQMTNEAEGFQVVSVSFGPLGGPSAFGDLKPDDSLTYVLNR